MKQIQTSFHTIAELEETVRKIRQWSQSILGSAVLIQIYTEILDQEYITKVVDCIKGSIPAAVICGCSSNGNILSGDFSGDSFVLVCSFFEYPSTKIETLTYDYREMSQNKITEDLRNKITERPWVKGVQLLSTIRGMSMTDLCEGLSELDDDVKVFGGAAFAADLNDDDACVFDTDDYLDNGVVFLLMGGEELHIHTQFVTGWKPLGSYLHVTKTKGSLLQELNGQPAYDIYYKYLHIKNDEHFFNNTLEFPFLYRHNGIDIMRAPTASNPDGTLMMTSDIEEGVLARIAYGDPWTIITTTYEAGKQLLPFAPEGITVFSCAARRTFWGNLEVGKETEVYQMLAPTSGFYTAGEFLRTGKYVDQHNVTQVVVAVREGEPRQLPEDTIRLEDNNFEGKVSMINRMATFIRATTEELEEANSRLHEMAIRDALTGVGNKGAYFTKIGELNEQSRKCYAVAVFDMNGLKGINDTFGHECGDVALKHVAQNLKAVFGPEHLYRIGGDEFIAVIEQTDAAKMDELFAGLDKELEKFNEEEHIYMRPLSISKGYAVYDAKADREYVDTFRKADEAMYRNKADYYRTHDRRKR
ncbi:MAG: diguanylate cyclase [Clostridiales bacterium]|nr:diguanylate cyclase [Clostridiales bacterium]